MNRNGRSHYDPFTGSRFAHCHFNFIGHPTRPCAKGCPAMSPCTSLRMWTCPPPRCTPEYRSCSSIHSHFIPSLILSHLQVLCDVLLVHVAEHAAPVRVPDVHQHVRVGVLGELEGRVSEPRVVLSELRRGSRDTVHRFTRTHARTCTCQQNEE